MTRFGLIGKQLSYSFSKKYFDTKFENENISNVSYELFELAEISEFPDLIKQLGNDFGGLNITIPYKKAVIPYLDELDVIAQRIGAVNVIKKVNGKFIGFNSDYFGFKTALKNWLDNTNKSALILGTGGASEAVSAVLDDLNIMTQFVSRSKGKSNLTYQNLDESIIAKHQLIINTTPLGTFPSIDEKLDIPYKYLTNKHYLFDLVYNPAESAYLKEGIYKGSKTKNGLEMLEQQAEEAWRIWNS